MKPTIPLTLALITIVLQAFALLLTQDALLQGIGMVLLAIKGFVVFKMEGAI